MQADVDKYYGMFVDSVAKNRGISSAAVKKNFGGGRTVMAKDAMEPGMVDGIATLTDLLGAIVPCKRGSARATAEAQIMLAEIGE
jgi:ClpP class serine protease